MVESNSIRGDSVASQYADAFAGLAQSTYQFAMLADALGLPAREGFSLRAWVDAHGGYQRLSIEERRQVVKKLPTGMSNRKAADVLGVTEGTIRSDRRAQNYADYAPPASSTRPENYAPAPEISYPDPPREQPIQTVIQDFSWKAYAEALEAQLRAVLPNANAYRIAISKARDAAGWRAS